MIWDRDYMKERPEAQEDEKSESQSAPFNLFAGVKEEPLPQQTPPNPPVAAAQPDLSGDPTGTPNRVAVLITIAIVVIIGVILGANFL